MSGVEDEPVAERRLVVAEGLNPRPKQYEHRGIPPWPKQKEE
jgi:hypothetical protein